RPRAREEPVLPEALLADRFRFLSDAPAVLEPGRVQPLLVLLGAVELLRGLELLPLAALGGRGGAREQLLALGLGPRLVRGREPPRLLEHALVVAPGDRPRVAG